MTFTLKTALAAALVSCALLSGNTVTVANAEPVTVRTVSGAASWYGPGFHGRKTANGERFNMNELTAAHKTLPFGTKVRVTNRKTGAVVIVRINDRGPFHGNRVIDLSRAAATKVGVVSSGVANVQLDILA